MSNNYVTQFEEALKQKFTEGLKTGEMTLFPGDGNVRFLGGKTVNIPKLTMAGLTDYARTGLNTSQAVSNEWDAKTMTHDRAQRFAIDPMDIEETGDVTAIAKISNVFITEKVIPEIDAYRFSKIIAGADTANAIANADLANDDVLAKWDDMVAKLDDAEARLGL